MPYYYLISEVTDSREEPISHYNPTYKKPDTINLLLPSIHASREDNILDAGSDADEAVRYLHASCRDSPSWPSSDYCDDTDSSAQNHLHGDLASGDCATTQNDDRPSPSQGPSTPQESSKPQTPTFAKYRPPSWAYDTIRPELLEAARALFYERKRQQAMYSATASSWGYSGTSRSPTEYELFAAWASLPRSDKLAYVSEVSGSNSSSVVTIDSLTTQRAVTSLLASCPDSCSWPSFQFSRIQAQQRQPPPPQPSRPYLPYHPYRPPPGHHQGRQLSPGLLS